MRNLTIAVLLSLGLLAGCATPSTLKSPCVGAPGSPCDRSPLPNDPIELPA